MSRPANLDPLISLLLPVFNVERFLTECLESVLNQSYSSFEVLVINDGSTDNTQAIVEQFAARDQRIRPFFEARNKGIAHALNKGISMSRGPFIARVDGDDVMYRDRLERQIQFLHRNPEVALVSCSYNQIDEIGRFIKTVSVPSDYGLLRAILKFQTPLPHIWLARREVYEKLEGYRLSGVEDYDFLLRMAKLGLEFSSVPNYVGMDIRIRDKNSISTFGIAQHRLLAYSRALVAGKEHYDERREKELVKGSTVGLTAYLHRTALRHIRCRQLEKNFINRSLHALAAVALSPYVIKSIIYSRVLTLLIRIWPTVKNK